MQRAARWGVERWTRNACMDACACMHACPCRMNMEERLGTRCGLTHLFTYLLLHVCLLVTFRFLFLFPRFLRSCVPEINSLWGRARREVLFPVLASDMIKTALLKISFHCRLRSGVCCGLVSFHD